MPSSTRRPGSQSAAGAPYAPSTWNHIPCSAHRSANGCSGSTEPVLVVPALATTNPGRRPAARSSAIAASTAATGMRIASSVGTIRTSPGAKPSATRPRPIDECVWSDRYATPGPSTARAVASAVTLASEPPLASTPSVPSGMPSSERSQSSTTSSTVAGPEPPFHDAAMALKPVPSQSPSTPAKDDGPGTRAK